MVVFVGFLVFFFNSTNWIKVIVTSEGCTVEHKGHRGGSAVGTMVTGDITGLLFPARIQCSSSPSEGGPD